MIKNFKVLTVFLLFLSCSEKTNKDSLQKTEIYTEIDSKNSNDTLINELNFEAKLIYGEYVSKIYLENIEKTKSVFNSKKYDNQSLFGFVLDYETLTSKNPFLKGFTVHEGGYDKPLKYDPIKNKFIYNLSKINEYESNQDFFEITKMQNNLEFFFPLKNKRELYKKVEIDFETELRKTLFEGNYNNTFENKTILFNKNGEVTNFKDYVYYEVIYDFSEGIEFDAILFFKTKEGGNWSNGDIYKYVINKSTINLNFVSTNWETLEHIVETETIVLKK